MFGLLDTVHASPTKLCSNAVAACTTTFYMPGLLHLVQSLDRIMLSVEPTRDRFSAGLTEVIEMVL